MYAWTCEPLTDTHMMEQRKEAGLHRAQTYCKLETGKFFKEDESLPCKMLAIQHHSPHGSIQMVCDGYRKQTDCGRNPRKMNTDYLCMKQECLSS